MANNPHLSILVQMAKIDGETDDSELQFIREIGISDAISDQDVDEIIASTEASDTIPSLEAFTTDQKVELMTDLVLVMKIDGKIHKEEMKFCSKVLKKLGYDENVLFDLVSTSFIDPEDREDRDKIKERVSAYLKDH
ncbi:MAG: TerB family tellurite resistance protein [Bacteroidota bacterium]